MAVEVTSTTIATREQDFLKTTNPKIEQEEIQGCIALSRTRLVANSEFQSLIHSDAHIKSAFNNYVKQSIMSLMYIDGEEGEEGEGKGNKTRAKFDFCPDFATLCHEMGFGIVTMSKLTKIGIHAARKYRQTFNQEPEKTAKYVNGGNHMVNTYRLEHLEWIKDCVREVMKPTV